MTETRQDEIIGKRIVELRERRGWTQGELARLLRERGLNWSQGTLSKVEAGVRPVRLSEVSALSLVLRTKIYDIVNAHLPVQTESDTKQRVRTSLPQVDTTLSRLSKVMDQLSESQAATEEAYRALRGVSAVFEDILEANEESGSQS